MLENLNPDLEDTLPNNQNKENPVGDEVGEIEDEMGEIENEVQNAPEEKNIENLLQQFNMSDCKPKATPGISNIRFNTQNIDV